MQALSTWFQLFAFFTQTNVSGDNIEIMTGQLLWASPDSIYIHIIEPVNQNVLLAGGKMLIYYPDEPKALEVSLNPNDPYAYLAIAPSVKPINEDLILAAGLIETQRTQKNDETHLQFRQKSQKNPYPIINITKNAEQITQLNTIKAMSVYTNMDIHEYTTVNDEVFLKSYTTSDFSANKLTGENNRCI